MEKMHLYFSHCISEDKLMHMSKNKVPGIPSGLKRTGIPCSVCQHAKIKRRKAALAATGSDAHDISFDMIDMMKMPTVSGKRYCTMIVERETRFTHTVLHETKDEIVELFKTVLPRLSKPAKIINSVCAAEYNTAQLVKLLKEHGVIEFLYSNEHGQAANGMVEKFETLRTRTAGSAAAKWDAVRVFGSSSHIGKGHLQLVPTYKSAWRLTTLQATRKTSRHVVFEPIRMWYGGISWQRFGGAPQAGAAGRKGRVFRYRQAVWSASIHVLLSTIESSICQLSLQGTVVDCFLEFTPVFSSRELEFDVCNFVFVVFGKDIKSCVVSEVVMRVFQHKMSSLDVLSSLNRIQYSVTLTHEFFLDILSVVSHVYDTWSVIRSHSQDNPTFYASIVRYIFCDTMLRIAEDLHANNINVAVCYLVMDRMATVGKSLWPKCCRAFIGVLLVCVLWVHVLTPNDNLASLRRGHHQHH